MAHTTITVPTHEIRKGDEFHFGGVHMWTAIADARGSLSSDVLVDVRHHPDGGLGTRIFSCSTELAITRPEETP